MIRFVLLLLLVLAGALVIALVRDQRGRRDERLDRLRWAFLHGTPLGGYAKPGGLQECMCAPAEAVAGTGGEGGLRFRIPLSWSAEVDGGARGSAGYRDPSDPLRRLRVELLRLEHPGGATTDTVLEALQSLEPGTERTVERLADGNVLSKDLEAGDPGAAVYTWRLGHPVPPRDTRIAVFRFSVPVAAAGDIVVQSDLSALDREIRRATFLS